jgi:hypothetical protein
MVNQCRLVKDNSFYVIANETKWNEAILSYLTFIEIALSFLLTMTNRYLNDIGLWNGEL